MTSSPLRGVLLDIDGTLIDSNDAHACSWVDVFLAAGFEAPFDRVRGLIGAGGDKLVPAITGLERGDPLYEELTARRAAVFQKTYLPQVRPQPGARPLLERLRAEGLRLVVATSATDDELGALLAVLKAEYLLPVRTTSSDAARSKPDPDIVQAAIERSGLRPAEVLMLGDTVYDITAARKAGVATIALRCGGWSDEDLQGASALYDDPAELLARYEDSPLARSRG